MSAYTVNSTVVHAALVSEVAQRDGALSRYRALREEYAMARLVRVRQQRLMASHMETLSQLQRCVASLLDLQSTTDDKAHAEANVPDTLVEAVRVLVAAERGEGVRESLKSTLARYTACRTTLSASFTAPGTCQDTQPLERSRKEQVAAEGRPALGDALPSAFELRPLLYWSDASLSYQRRLLDARRLLASEVARARCQAALLTADNTTNGFAGAAAAQKQQASALEEARAELKSAKDFQRCVKRRLYEVHQQIARETLPANDGSQGRLAPEAAAAMRSQITKELRNGRVTLLRILCQEIGSSWL
ncbi:hypothetical protein ABB37_09791 [Leptomonas pyrrhocoris]|uniref:Uncharacterized protein n=1 Tax=Leptomonas pyrrhocoris TaxID=157538 RepID=A0A0N0DQT3_LEPPY|nr:hypothetical protein ABB37_09791 [Leptomonas pyrrhocoris]KPA73464.1 hypothetical protein ABB37_09791 [Leptomonas pyrrhocoris]|eukprot:XP_015651903.1 hypothetical protein ABB37_09791 [Leptomonas pyrrhocoris]